MIPTCRATVSVFPCFHTHWAEHAAYLEGEARSIPKEGLNKRSDQAVRSTGHVM